MSYNNTRTTTPGATTPDGRISDEKAKVDVEYNGGEVYDKTYTAALSTADGDGPATLSDDRETKRIMRKLDWRILPVCSVLYLFSFLDRTAIGNARVS